ncbi:MAG: hypothetical protein AB7P23_08925 [Amphiplicatus sp.]
MRMLIVGLVLLAGACATAVGTAYAPADKQGYGYTETRIESDRYRVAFAGDGATPPETVESYALRRAAELALAGGYDWFRVVARSMGAEEKGGVGVGAGFGSGSVGRRSSIGVGVGGDLGVIGAKRFYTARIEVLMGKDPAPEGDDVYDARSVIDMAGDRASATN